VLRLTTHPARRPDDPQAGGRSVRSGGFRFDPILLHVGFDTAANSQCLVVGQFSWMKPPAFHIGPICRHSRVTSQMLIEPFSFSDGCWDQRSGPKARGGGVLSSQACLTTRAVVSRKTASMLVQNDAYFKNPSTVPIFSFSSCLPTEANFSIPKIWPPALCTTWAYCSLPRLNLSCF
jgi:hypothetical protein